MTGGFVFEAHTPMKKINSALSRAELLRAIGRSGAWSRPQSDVHPISAAEMRRAIARQASHVGRVDQTVVLRLAEVLDRLDESATDFVRTKSDVPRGT